MKKKSILIMMMAMLLLSSQNLMAQAFGGKGSRQVLLGLGVNQHTAYFGQNNQGLYGSYSPQSGGLSFQMEFGIHQYVGLGFFAGIEGFSNYSGGAYNPGPYGGAYYNGYGYKNNYYGMAIPVGFQANFHFLQLIADKTGKNFADKLDVYAGLSVGTGVMFVTPRKETQNNYPGAKLNDVGPMIYGGPHVGIRFYPTANFGIFAEVGYGKTLAQGGICFKM